MAMAVPFFLAFSVLLHFVFFHSVLAQTSCPKSFDCGDLGPISFPFSNFTHSQCGLCKVACEEPHPQIQLGNEGPWYELIENNITQTNKILVQIRDQTHQSHLDDRSCDTFSNYTFPNSPSISFTIPDNLTLFKCNVSSETSLIDYSTYGFYNYSSCRGQYLFYRYPDDRSFIPATLSRKCSVIQLPLNTSNMEPDATDPFDLLAANFSIELHVSKDCQKCHMTGGQCQNNNQKFYCAAKEGKTDFALIPSPGVAPLPSVHKIPGVAPLPSVHKIRGSNSNLKIKVVIGIAATGMAITITLFCYFMRKCLSSKFPILGKLVTEDNHTFETFLKNFGSLAPKRYSYSEIKKITNSFKDRLGQGGFGSVYKGKLPNGHLVAVKVLKESNGNGEEFVNEVASISRTSHVNIVTLLGFCFEGHKRALIYEFMPNGSLEKFIYQRSSSTERQLGWETLFKVAIGIARGLEYLHLGCRTRILHFDIMPHNILLDEDFCPKISDFGLAKLCLKKESIISMLGTRGTAGYIAPEVFSRNYGGVSYKSDVYSYGMMILEMVGGRKNIDVGVDHTSEIYFPDWIYSRLQPDEEIGLHGITNEEENERSRKMIIVGLWCIQTDPSNRPSMSRVVEMLEGNLESLQIPPKPFLSSPPRAPADSTTT